jgi:hypothetical protein
VTVTPALARATWTALEPLHAMVYFAPEPQEEYAALGYDVKGNRPSGYFPSRAAAMGAVGEAVVHATFYNFSRAAVQAGMAGAWQTASPEDVQAARWRGAERALRRLLGPAADAPQVEEAAALARTAAQGGEPYGRPLFAANAALPEPEGPLLQLFHAQTLLREHRGDGHLVALVGAQVTGLEAAVLHVATGESWTRRGLQRTRGYTDAQWDGAVARLVERGELTPEATLTEAGRAHRTAVEDETDRLSVRPYARLGEDGCARLQELGRPLAQTVLDAGGLGVR